jgi:arginine decarboxylase
MSIINEQLRSYFFCSGSAEAPTPLNAFDAALLNAGVGNTNLMKISSILPPGCNEITLPEVLPPGILLPTAWVSYNSNNSNEQISAAVAAAIPHDPSRAGVIMEHAGVGSATDVEQHACDQLNSAMRIRKISNYEVKSISISHQVTLCGTVFAAIVLQR